MGRSRSRSRSRNRDSHKNSHRHRRSNDDIIKHSDSKRERHERRRRSSSPHNYKRQHKNSSSKELHNGMDEERDSRTIFAWQLSKRIDDADLRTLFSRAGTIKDIRVIRDPRTNKPKGIAYVEFVSAESVPHAMQYVGTRIKGVPIQINQILDKPDMSESATSMLDNEYTDRGGVGLGNTGRLALMAKLAEGTGIELPQQAQEVMRVTLGGTTALAGTNPVSLTRNLPTVAQSVEPRVIGVGDIINMRRQAHSNAFRGRGTSECFMINNMFSNNPEDKHDESFYTELCDDVKDECQKLGRVSQVVVDQRNPGGNVYVRCYGPEDAKRCVTVMHGRFFSGRQLTATIISLGQFHQLSLASR